MRPLLLCKPARFFIAGADVLISTTLTVSDDDGRILFHSESEDSPEAEAGFAIPLSEIDTVMDALADVRDKYGPTVWTVIVYSSWSGLQKLYIVEASDPPAAVRTACETAASETGEELTSFAPLAAFAGRHMNHCTPVI